MALPFQRAFPLVLLALAAGLAACDTNSEEEGRFVANVRDASTGSPFQLNGRALFSVDDNGQFIIEMVPRSDQSGAREGLFLGRGEAGLPEEGQSYAFTAPGDEDLPTERFAGALLLSFRGGSSPALYHTIGGGICGSANSTLQVSTITEERIEGTFCFVAELVQASGNVGAPRVMEVNGSFDAERGLTDNFPQ